VAWAFIALGGAGAGKINRLCIRTLLNGV